MKKKVLLVEDDKWLSDLYAGAVGKEVELVRAATAEEALTAIDTRTIDIIVLDMFLPGHNGIELIHELASYQDSLQIPIIILSSVAERDFGLKKHRFMHYNIVEYLYKPAVKPADVARVVYTHLNSFVSS